MTKRQLAERLVRIRRLAMSPGDRARKIRQDRAPREHPSVAIEIDPEILAEIHLALKDGPTS